MSSPQTSPLAPIRASLKHAHQRSSSHRSFMPEGFLGNVLTKGTISFVLSSDSVVNCEAELTRVVDDVYSRGSKVLAILILLERTELFSSFLERGLCDDKLPFNKQQLDLTALDDATAELFLVDQFAFLAPVFTKDVDHLSLDSRHILPFIKDKVRAHGAFGVVYEIEIYAENQRLESSASGLYETKSFARKEFRITPDCEKKFKAEKKTLKLLLRVKHPNIIPLLGTYSYGEHFNMIFPLAETTLFEYLRSEPKPPAPARTLFKRFYYLIDALHILHNFTHEENGIKLQRLGYHHDLKPQNILVQNERFIIADFGLANFKSIDESSKTSWKMGTRGYGAPEARNGDVGRAYDIWSLACILAEFVTFVVMGSGGVTKFVDHRTTLNQNIMSDCFHDGKKVKLEVLQHFQDLRSTDQPGGTIDLVLGLVEEMLEPDVGKRPVSGTVLRRFAEILGISSHPSPENAGVGSSEPLSTYLRQGFPASQSPFSIAPSSPTPISYPSTNVLEPSEPISDSPLHATPQPSRNGRIPVLQSQIEVEDPNPGLETRRGGDRAAASTGERLERPENRRRGWMMGAGRRAGACVGGCFGSELWGSRHA